MNVKIVTVLILWIIVIDGYLLKKKKIRSKKDNLDCHIKIKEGEKLICTDIVYKPHTDNYDITTIYKTTPENNSGEEDIRNPFITANGLECYDVKIHLRTNAIGMPINFNGFVPNSDTKSLEFIADRKYPKRLNNIFTQNQIKYNTIDWTITTISMSNEAEPPRKFNYNLLLWKANTNEESFKIKWKQRNSIKMCISISYLLEDESKCTLSVELTDGENLKKKIMNAYAIKESRDLKTLLLKNDYWLNKNQTYSLNFKLLKNKIEPTSNTKFDFFIEEENNTHVLYAEGCKIGIKRIAQCTDEYENEDILTINEKELQDTPSNVSLTFNVYPFDNEPQQNIISPSSECHNGGFANYNGCVCPPGFKGNNCEYGCGPNKFGADCTGICSIHQTRCRQMMMCTKGFGCKCPAGFSGLQCTKECTSGTYGVNCEQQCPKACLTSCNIYTGVCNKGCIASYIAPDCREKYPWLESPPQLESSDFTSIKLKIDFNSENIGGSRNVNPMFYQIMYKIARNESEFQYLELKEIGKQKSVVETTENLKPGISYTFGVILVSEDGNYNIEDIITVNYSTNCLLPVSTNYDVNLLSGLDYINVTWNKLNDQDEGYCKITVYLLRLIFKNLPLQQQTYLEEVKSNKNNGYIFENLLPNEKYAVQVTAITATGQTKPSILSFIYTEPNEHIQIKNIKTKFNENSTLIITWDINESHTYKPLNFEIKYKVNKYFSCSNKIITNNWTSLLVYNQTRQEISNLIPNAQYIIKVELTKKGYTYDDYSNMIYVKTPISKPMITPLIINEENSSYITNRSAHFNWKINKTECSKLNGFFRGYQVILKDIVERTQVAKSVKENMVNYNGLKPDTNYELQIYVMTNHGYNLEQGLLIPFKTKTKFLVPVNELIVYKKNLKKKSIGIRWSYPNENDMNGFIVIAIDENLNNTKRIIIEPAERCIAWPKFYCTTFDNLIPNNQYTIKVKAKSLDYPTGGPTASVVTNFIDGFAGKPENLRTTSVGSTYISLEWGIPYILNGVLKSFIVNIKEILSQKSVLYVEFPIIEELPTYNCTIYDLKPGFTYSIGVLSKTSSNGQTSTIYVTTLVSTIATIVDVDTEQPIQVTT